MKYSCDRCGQEWDQHPVTLVECPECGVPAGTWCRRPSEWKAAELHVDREWLALERGVLQKCPAGPEGAADQPDLFPEAP